MANHKRKKPKHQRSGCLFCKPWKDERQSSTRVDKVSVQRKLQPDERELRAESGQRWGANY